LYVPCFARLQNIFSTRRLVANHLVMALLLINRPNRYEGGLKLNYFFHLYGFTHF